MRETNLKYTYEAREVGITVQARETEQGLELEFRVQGCPDCLLHWGLSPPHQGAWMTPPPGERPRDTRPAGGAVQTRLEPVAAGQTGVTLLLTDPDAWGSLPFVLYSPSKDRWYKDAGGDFRVTLPVAVNAPPGPALDAALDAQACRRRDFDLGDGDLLSTAVCDLPDQLRVVLASSARPPLLLHWGLAPGGAFRWQAPPVSWLPPGSALFDERAARTRFEGRDGLQWCELHFPKAGDPGLPRGINLVLFQPERNVWLKHHGHDIHLTLGQATDEAAQVPPHVSEIAGRIVEAEVGRGSWTLMHRFDLCHDLLDDAAGDPDALALIYVWLRFSAIRQLDWQRNFNTKPRELAHAQDRLTRRMATLHQRLPHARPWIRLMLTTVGRGGEGQQVRDEILHIMHRHHIKEVHGHFLEEWHQKLHNNTTPDDVVICEAYLAFLRHHGDPERFYAHLESQGVSRERLAGFERPIVTAPEFYGDKRDGLLHDFEHFLRILKSVHSGTDLDTAVEAAWGTLDPAARGHLEAYYQGRSGGLGARDQMWHLLQVRRQAARQMGDDSDDVTARDLLYLDLALEQTCRALVEGQPLSQLAEGDLLGLTLQALENARLSLDENELSPVQAHLEPLLHAAEQDREWALEVWSAMERTNRALAAWSTRLHNRLQPLAEYLGEACRVEAWTIPLFSEEVVRGGPAFALSHLLRQLDPLLRKRAGMGGWQVISPARAAGRVRVIDDLREIQSSRFPEATVLVADQVHGDEEIPPGITSVITRDLPDLVSHVAVRARNTGVLFASCFEPETYEKLKDMQDRPLFLEVTPTGDVVFQTGEPGQLDRARPPASAGPRRLHRRGFSTWAVDSKAFNRDVLGGKSNNLVALAGSLPDWVRLPEALAIPFGGFEKALEHAPNHGLARLVSELSALPREAGAARLESLRQQVQAMEAPPDLRAALLDLWQRSTLPEYPWERVWDAIKGVWASKWNERAFLARAALGIPDDDLNMAVLIQRVMPAEYAFVLHTVNPLNGSPGELFGEVVLGLGETLVGNHPGQALGFTITKPPGDSRLLSLPSKSFGLFGGGVIFRSDSNGEDLEGYAGAGLYDSILLDPPEVRRLDYSHEPLVRDRKFRRELLESLARLGTIVEDLSGAPQDIEGTIHQGRYYLVQTRPQVGLSPQ